VVLLKNVLNKIINIVLVFGMFLTVLPLNSYALETENVPSLDEEVKDEVIEEFEIKKGIVKSSLGNGINLRGGAGTTYERVGGLDDGRIVTIVDLVDTDDGTIDSCAKWYKIAHNTGYAYACTTFINIVELSENPLYNYEEELAKFPESYKSYIESLHEIYPNAIFIREDATDKSGNIMDFNTAVSNENVLGKSLIWDTYPVNTRNGLKSMDSYDIITNSFYNKYPGGGNNWYAASYDTIAYYMDPRNFLSEKRVFMFESQSYNSTLHTVSGVETVLSGSYMANSYVDGSNITFSQAIIDAAIYSNISPYFIASRILQEVGTTRSSLVLGTYANYPEFNGYYNYYNIGAGGDNVVYNGLAKAYENGWDSEYKAIVYGSSWIGNNYINSGQDTGYYQKWDVKCSGQKSCFTHQYMQNIEAPNSEALSTYNAYKKTNGDAMYLNPYVFYIPVYNNMSDEPVLKPSESSPINYLSNITINKNVLANFDGLVTEYSITVPYNTTVISVEANGVDSSCSISGVGNIEFSEDKKDIVITVTAKNGSTRDYIVHVTREEKKEIVEISLSDAIAMLEGIKFNENIASGVTSIDVLKEKINSTNTGVIVTITDKDGNTLTSGNLGTGYKFSLSLNDEEKVYEMILYGDTNGDAEVTILDLLRVQKYLLKSSNLTDNEIIAADVNKDGNVSILDLLLVQKHLLGSKYIEQ